MLPFISNLSLELISTLIFYLLTYFLHMIKSLFKNKEQIKKANSEILSTIKPIIAQQDLISEDIIESVVYSVARENELDRQLLLSVKEIKDDCIKEILQNEFLTTNQKVKIMDKLSKDILNTPGKSNQKKKEKINKGKYSLVMICTLIFIALWTILQPFFEAKSTPCDVIVQLMFYISIAVFCIIGIILYAYKLFK